MLFSTVTFTEFDVSKKSDWLFADFCCLLDTWAAMVAASIVLSIIVYGITGIHPLAEKYSIQNKKEILTIILIYLKIFIRKNQIENLLGSA